ncbi:AAA family ATPase [Pedobacter sp. AW31-3R]|uniref:AAA family ATPase n=1 Tax=Pedobacter sp. AW31-3R TaxID=3445781 RepID=UPI003FA16CD6
MNISDLLINDKEQVSLNDLFLDEASKQQFVQLIKEHSYIEELHQYGLPVNNKIMLHGSTGCGKTTTAKAIATSLGKNIMILNLSNIICSRIGETSQNIKMVFDKARKEKAVLFLDEFDQIGKTRSVDDKDVGEMRRLVNTMIQLIDYYPEDALLICATNHESFIDPALLRRFQLSIGFTMPTPDVLDGYYDQLLSRFPANIQQIPRKYGISFAEARDYAFTTVKKALIQEIELRGTPVEA